MTALSPEETAPAIGNATVLVVDDDPDMATHIAQVLGDEGFEVTAVHSGKQARERVARAVPEIAILDATLSGGDGIELCAELRANPATASVPVLLLTPASNSAERVAAMRAGVDDTLDKPFDTLELVTRVRSILQRNADMRAVSPLTGLPGNHSINREIARRTAADEDFAVCHVDLDHFKAFNDRYGWMRGDDVIALLADALKAAAGPSGPPPPFVGHIGGDDFVVVCAPDQAAAVCNGAVDRFEAQIRELYDADDVEAGHLSVVDRQGHERTFPLTSVSIGVATTDRRNFNDYRDVVAVAAEMKSVAKARTGSAVAIDRRAD